MSEEYIKREDALMAILALEDRDIPEDRYPDTEFAFNEGLVRAADKVNDIPAADVVECKPGLWLPSTVVFPVKNTDGTYRNFGTLVCSNCNNPVALVKWNNYCPCCGSYMRGDR